MGNDVTIRALTALDEILPIEKLQEEIWGYGSRKGPPFPYPARCLFEFAESGGLVAGAFDRQQIVGFAVAWIGREKNNCRLYLHSQLVGILEEYRDMGLGYRLKMFQKDFALQAGLSLIKWTFDPLQTRNAYLNLHKLGAIVRKFAPNYYGYVESKQNEGMPTDRFWAEWYIDGSLDLGACQANCAPEDLYVAKAINTVEWSDGRPYVTNVELNLEDGELIVVVPNNIQELRRSHKSVAVDWQDKLRQIFKCYLPKYYVVDFIRDEGCSFYLLKRIESARARLHEHSIV